MVNTPQRQQLVVPTTPKSARTNVKMAATATLPRVDRFVAGSVSNEPSLSFQSELGTEPLVIMKNSDVENYMWFVSAASTMKAQNLKLEQQAAEMAKVAAKTVHQPAPSVSYK